MNCLNKQKNISACNCSYEPCARKGLCCECLRYHRANSELPACYFSDTAEKTYDRSINHFLKINKTGAPEERRPAPNSIHGRSPWHSDKGSK